MKLSHRLLGLALLAIPLGCGGGGSNPTVPPPAENELRIGGLFSLTGNWNTLGRASQAAVELAQEDVNSYLAEHGSTTRVRVEVGDTKLDPALALTKMTDLAANGATVFIGPQSSSEVAAVKATADAEGLLVVSQGSTSSALSLPNDFIFRMVPDDVREAAALVALLEDDGVKAIVPVAREDSGNGGLYTSTRAAFIGAGGSVSAGVRYGTDVTDFTATLAAIRAQVETLRATHADAEVAIYLAAFDEAADILAAAKNDAVLATVKWYGSDGVVQSTVLVENADAAAFAVTSGYPNPIFGLSDEDEATWGPVAARIKARSGVDADAFALSAYDAVWLAALAHETPGANVSATAYRNAFAQAAEGYVGVTGSTKLDAAGDRDSGNFDFWSIVASGATFEWKRTAIYQSSNGAIIRTP